MDEFCAITGLDEDSSAIYMEMGGYDLDTALQLFFSMNDGDTGGGNPAPTSGGGWPHEWMGFLFPSPSLSGSHSVPDAWLQQGLQTIPTPTTDWSALNILQHKNGPCGVLAAFQGYLITHLLDDHTLSPTYQPTIRDTIAAVTRLLHTVAPPSPGSVVPLKICCWQDPINGVGGAVVISEDADGVFLSKVIDQYLAPGGVLLLLCSALHTFGADVLQQQHSALLPLLSGQHALCSSALMNILLTGEANETLGAYNDCGARIPWNKPKASVGLLSGTEIELKMKIHDGFKCPAHEVYVLHGRDHFTTLLVIPLQTSSQASKEPQASSWAITMPPPVPHEESSFMCATTPSTFTEALSFSLVHFNGLPPAGPAVSLMNVVAAQGVSPLNPPSASQGIPSEYRPIVNTIDCVVQASSQDKIAHPQEWTRWRYEIALTVEDPDNRSPERPPNLPPLATFALNPEEVDDSEGWRCRLCFETRFTTMCFGQNNAGSSVCQHCRRTRAETGWTLWLPYEQIPRTWQASIDRQYGPMIATVLRTKWPNCTVEYAAGSPLPVV